jgi:hypothetical protein
MGVYKTTSINEVIGRIIRNIKLTDSSWENDIYEWLWEGMEKCKVRTTLDPSSEELEIKNHEATFPCNLISLDAVISNGYRLRQTDSILNVPNIPQEIRYQTGNTLFETSVNKITVETTDKITSITSKDSLYKYPVNATQLPFSSQEFYKLVLNRIQTSFCDGCVTILYLKYLTDEDGLILIPDNEDLKTALYWYVLHMMIGAGFEHPIFKYTDAEQRWLDAKDRAINSLRNWSPDRVHEFQRTWVNLMPPSPLFHNRFNLNY